MSEGYLVNSASEPKRKPTANDVFPRPLSLLSHANPRANRVSIGFALLLVTASADARGGLGDALGAAIELVIGAAIISAIVCGLLLGRKPFFQRLTRFVPYLVIPVFMVALLGPRGLLMIIFLMPLGQFGSVSWSLSVLLSTPAAAARGADQDSDIDAARAGWAAPSCLNNSDALSVRNYS
jgi:hypothetical protein